MFLIRTATLAELEKSPNPLPALVLVVIESILEVFFLCLVGWILARKGIVDDKAKKTLNKLNVSLFTPALLFSKVAFSLTPDKLADLIIIPIGFFICTIFSASIAYLVAKLFRLKKGQRNFAIACTMFQNSNSLPIALMQSLIGEKMPLRWGSDDTKDSMLGRALSYLVLFSTLGIIVRWSVGVRLLTSAETEQDDPDELESDLEDNQEEEQGEEVGLLGTDTRARGSDAKSRRRRTASGLLTSRQHHHSNGNGNGSLGNGIENGIEGAGAWATSPSRSRKNTNHSSSGETTSSSLIENENENGSIKGAQTEETVLLVQEPQSIEDHSLSPNAGTKGKRIRKRDRIFPSYPNTPIPSSYGGSEFGDDQDEEQENGDDDDGEDEEVDLEDREWGASRGVGRKHVDHKVRWFEHERFEKIKRVGSKVWRPVKRVGKKIGAFMTVPLWAALLSLVVACIPPLQWALNEAEPLKSAIKNAGNCSVPITLVTLGAYFYRPSAPATKSSSPKLPLLQRLNPLRKLSPTERRERRLAGHVPGETRTVFVSVLSRMIIVPSILIPLFGWYAARTINVADDPIFVVTACLLIGSPTAITLAQITSSAAGDTFEKLISKTLFVSYAIMTAPCTIALVLAALYIDRHQ